MGYSQKIKCKILLMKNNPEGILLCFYLLKKNISKVLNRKGLTRPNYYETDRWKSKWVYIFNLGRHIYKTQINKHDPITKRPECFILTNIS